MNGPRPRRATHRRRTLTIVAIVAVAFITTGFLVVRSFLARGGHVDPVPIEEVVRRYQASTSPDPSSTTSVETTVPSAGIVAPTVRTTTAPAADLLPRPGVYVYATTGSDSIDAATGARHDYPALSAVTVTAAGCGTRQRWDVAEQRWQEWEHCAGGGPGGGVVESERVNHDEFFGIAQTDTWACTGDPRPLDAPAGTTWVRTCRKGDHDDVHTGTVIGPEQVDVGGTQVEAFHVRVTIDNGRPSDGQTTDSWYARGSDLLVMQTASNHTTNDTDFGTVHYEEQYEIGLTSLDPVQ